MTEIILSQNNGNVTADSRMVAEHFEKDHRHILVAIENIKVGMPKIGQTPSDYFIPTTYTHEQNGQTYKNYQLTRDGFSLLVMGFTGSKALEWKLKYIKAFNEMLNHISTLRTPTNFAEALRLAADQAELIERQKPLVMFAETCAKSDKSILIRELAKIASGDGVEIGEKRLYQKLRDWRLLFGNNEPYQEYVDRGYFEVTQGCHENSSGTFLHKTTRALPKGQQYIIARLRAGV